MGCGAAPKGGEVTVVLNPHKPGLDHEDVVERVFGVDVVVTFTDRLLLNHQSIYAAFRPNTLSMSLKDGPRRPGRAQEKLVSTWSSESLSRSSRHFDPAGRLEVEVPPINARRNGPILFMYM